MTVTFKALPIYETEVEGNRQWEMCGGSISLAFKGRVVKKSAGNEKCRGVSFTRLNVGDCNRLVTGMYVGTLQMNHNSFLIKYLFFAMTTNYSTPNNRQISSRINFQLSNLITFRFDLS